MKRKKIIKTLERELFDLEKRYKISVDNMDNICAGIEKHEILMLKHFLKLLKRNKIKKHNDN
ncbi:MAG TPA: hypothetical protein PKL13_04345 [bacterium]|nr:hypothetical protein [bacterium]